ncbi:extracellular solute-binding protein, partial [Paenibacillus sp. MCAF20]
VEQAAAQLFEAVESKQLIRNAERQIKLARPLLLNGYMLDVIQGDPDSLRKLEQRFVELQIPLSAKGKVLLVIGRVDDWHDEFSNGDRDLMLYAIQNIAEEYFGKSTNCLTVSYERNKLLLILQPLDRGEAENWTVRFVQGTIETIQMACKQLLKLSVSFAAAGEMRSWEQAPGQFSALKRLLGRGLGTGKELILLDGQGSKGGAPEMEVQTHEVRSQLEKLGTLAVYLENGQRQHFHTEYSKLMGVVRGTMKTDDSLKLEIYYSLVSLFLSYMNRWGLHAEISTSLDMSKLARYDAHRSWDEADDYLSLLSERLFEQKHNDQIYQEDDLIKHVQLKHLYMIIGGKYMKQKSFSMLLTSVLVFTLVLTACSNGANEKPVNTDGTSQPGASQGETIEKGDPFEKYDPPVELHIARPIEQTWTYPQGDSIDNNVWYREYESLLGIKVVHDWTALASEYNRKLNVSIASGSLPEVFSVSASQLKQLADAGQLEDLTGAYEKYASDHTKELQMGDGGAALASATFGGKLLAIPVVNAPIYEPNLLWVRTDWLEKLGLPEPKTIEDVFAISEAFTNKDPDGNSKNDTFGIAINNYLYGPITSITGFSNAYHAYPQTWVKDDSGKVSYGSVQPEMKQALAKLQEMYKGGQLDREFGVKDSNKVAEDIAANKFGMAFGANWNPYVFYDAVKKNPGMEWKPFPVPSIDETPTKASAGFSASGYVVVRKGFKHPEAVVKMLNLHEEVVHGSRRNEGQFITVEEGGERINTSRLSIVQSGVSNQGVLD